MTSVEQRIRQKNKGAASVDGAGDERREKTTNLRSKRRGNYMFFVDKSIFSSMVPNLPGVGTTEFSPETLALVQEFEKRKQREKKERALRHRARSARQRERGGKKR